MSFPAKLRSWISQFLNRSIEVRLSSQLKCLRIGSDYGGWSFCPQGLGADSVIYSAGIGDDLSFDLGMIERFGCAVHAFDPTPRCFEWVSRQQLPQQLRFFPEAVGGRDETLTLYPLESPASVNHTLIARPGLEQHAIRVPCSRIPTLMNRFKHERIDVLKLDIEGAEYAVIDDLLASGVEVPQLLVEFHHRFHEIGLSATRKALRGLEQKGYQVLAATAGAREVSFVHQSLAAAKAE